jgi:geranylgeranyl pyrophosphate synthase
LANTVTEICQETKFESYLDNKRKLIDSEITRLALQVPDLALREKIEYALQTRGKRLRPILLILSAQSSGGTVESVIKLSLAIELLHGATLIHDDILDQDILRRKTATLNAKWGVRDAILVGDALASLALCLTAEYGKEITKIISQTCLLLSDGEYLDVENSKKTPSESTYILTVKRKSASLFKAATQCGAIACSASTVEIDALADFGENLGLAYQIKDDLSDITAVENIISKNVDDFRATLPMIHLYEFLKPEPRELLLKELVTFKSQSISEKKKFIEKLQQLLQNTDTITYGRNLMNQYIHNAIQSIGLIHGNIYKDYLCQIAESLRF